jgi:hypothetical protein
MSDFYTWVRLFNLALCGVLAVVMLTRVPAFLRASVDSRYGRMTMFSIVTATGYNTAEVLWQHAPAGPRVVTTTYPLLMVSVWVWAEIRYSRRQRARLAEASAGQPLLPQQVADLGDGLGEGAHFGEGLPGRGVRGQHMPVGVVGVGAGAASQR